VLLDSIRTQLDSLSKSEKKVALAVLEQPAATVSQNITALAKSAQVSEPTVVRFCRTLGYDGWHEFKLKLAQGLALERNLFLKLCVSESALARMRSYEGKKITSPSRGFEV